MKGFAPIMFTQAVYGALLTVYIFKYLTPGRPAHRHLPGLLQHARLVANGYLLPYFKAALLQPFAAQAQVRKSYIIVAIGSHGRCAPVKESFAYGKCFGARREGWLWCRFSFTLKQRCCIAVSYRGRAVWYKRGLVIYPF